MRKTAEQLWDEAEEGQAFACRFVPEEGDDLDNTAEVIWIKGDVDCLGWDDLLWITPVQYTGERTYR